MKGDWLLRGNVWVDHYEIPESKSYRINYFRSQIGYYFKKGLCLGIIDELSFNTKYWSTFGAQPFFRATLFKKRFSPFVQLSGGWKEGKNRFKQSNDYTLWHLNLRAGVGLRIGKMATIDLSTNLMLLHHLAKGRDEKMPPVFTSSLHLSYHFSHDNTGFDSMTIQDVYFQKGNKTIGLDVTYFPTAYGSIMINERVQFAMAWSSFLGGNEYIGNYAWNHIIAEVRPFFRIRENTFFTPNMGASFTSVVIQKPFDLDGRLQLRTSPKMVHFSKRIKLEVGLEAQYLLHKKESEQERFSANTMLGVQYFLSPQLTLNAEIRGALVGSAWPGNGTTWQNIGGAHFQLGFRYFYQKQTKN